MANKHHFVTHVLDNYKHENHSDVKGNIIFQCKPVYSNVVFNSKSLQAIMKNSRGFEQLGETISNPDSIFSSWVDPEHQTSVKRVYIKGKYVVFTTDSIITNAYLVDDVNSVKEGVMIL